MMNNKNQQRLWILAIIIIIFFSINPIFGFIAIVIIGKAIKKNPELLQNLSADLLKNTLLKMTTETKKTDGKTINANIANVTDASTDELQKTSAATPYSQDKISVLPNLFLPLTKNNHRLERKKKYIQIALNSNLNEAAKIIRQLPSSEKIIIEAGTPLIKTFGLQAINKIKRLSGETYIVADNKIADMAEREVKMMASAGASAATCLGVAPIETINEFIKACNDSNLDSMLDMMNVKNPLIILKKLKTPPNIVILHRGVDETKLSMEKQLPFYQINQIKGAFNIMVAVAGGDTPREIQGAIFNGADIVVVWKNFYQADENIGQLARDFLKEIK